MGAAESTPDHERTPVPAKPARLTPHRELQLVEAYRAGDGTALAELLTGYQRRIHAVCRRMVPTHADDLTQETLLKLVDGLSTYDGRAMLSTWIIRVTMNCCLSHIRKAKLRNHASLSETADDGATIQLPVTREPSILQRVERAEAYRLVEAGLEELDPVMRAILVLRDLQGLEYQQIADVLDVPIGTVKSRLFRARAALREAIEAASSDREEEV